MKHIYLRFQDHIYNQLYSRNIRLSNKNHFLVKIFYLTLKLLGLSLKFFGIKFVKTNLQHRIGHQITEPLAIDLKDKNGLAEAKYYIFLAPEGIANDYVTNFFPKKFIFVKNKLLSKVLRQIYIFDEFTVDIADLLYAGQWPSLTASKIFLYLRTDINEYYNNGKFLKIPDKASVEVKSLLSNLGISSSDWYVCIHNRSNLAYDEPYFSHRNSNFKTLILSIEFIIKKGGKVVRVGEPDEYSEYSSSRIIQYSNSKFKNAKNDILINSYCSFFIGSTSGLLAIPASSGIPVVSANTSPLAASKIWGPRDIGVPKIYKSRVTGEILGFKSILNGPIGNFYTSSQFDELDISVCENSSEEILWAVQEMYDKAILKNIDYNYRTDLQVEFDNLFNKSNYTYYSKTPISAKFLEKYRDYIHR